MATNFIPNPSPDLQPYTVPAPAYVSPLQTLAQMSQLRSGALQQQQQQQAIQQGQMELESNRAMLDAMVQGGGDPEKTYSLMQQSGKVLPQDLFKVQGARADLLAKTALYNKTQLENLNSWSARYQAALDGVANQQDMDAANTQMTQEGMPNAVPRITQFTDPNHLKAFTNSLSMRDAIIKQKLETAQAQETETKTAAADRSQAISELQAARGQDGSVTPQTLMAIQARHPTVKDLPPGDSASVQQYIASQVPEAERPKYEIEEQELGAMKNLTPQSLATMVGGSIDPSNYPEQYKRTLNDAQNALRFGLGMKGVQAAIKDGSDRVAQRENVISQAQVTTIPFREAQLEQNRQNQLMRSYQFHASELDKLATPVTQLNQRLQRLNDAIGQNTPQADALVAPELLSVMSGGMGSGLRMNEAEIARLVGGRSKWESLKASINQWSLDPSKATSITAEQRQEIRSLVDEVTKRGMAQQSVLMNARSALAGASGPEQHRAILADTTNKLGAINTPAGSPAARPAPPVGTVQGGYRFKGGDPSQQANWEKVP